MFKEVFEPREDEENYMSEELHGLYLSSNSIRVIKSRRM
jgi:hypothetical protein